MNFSKEIKSKSEDLIKKARKLPLIKIKWEKSIKINCSKLEKLKTEEAFNVLKKNKHLPCVYYFKIKSKNPASDIVSTLQKYKEQNLRSCPKIDKKRNMNSKFLYCGSRKEGVHGRFIQHLGFGSRNTFALQLHYWAKAINLQLEFHYAWLNEEQIDFTELIESAMANKLKPLVGKIQL